MKFQIEVFKVGDRLRARLIDEEGYSYGEWWLTSRSGVRYMPLKPAPPKVRAVIDQLPTRELRRVVLRLYIAKPGDVIEFEVGG